MLDTRPVAEALGLSLAWARLAGRYDSGASLGEGAVSLAIDQGARLPFDRQIAFFRRKLNLTTQSWTDIWQEEHDKAFVVAGATKGELLLDLRGAVDAAIADGETLAAFRKRFDGIVETRGWSYKGGRNWRTRVIYDTNLRASYAAGRFEQMTEMSSTHPYWRYRHSHISKEPRADHLAWHNLVLRHDDPWWRTNYPPNGWGCKCHVEALSDRDMRRLGKDGPDQAPALDKRLVTTRDGRILDLPAGVDPGWAYAPGRTVAQRAHQAAWRNSLDDHLRLSLLDAAAPTHRFAPELTAVELIAVRHWTTSPGHGTLQPPLRKMMPPEGGRGIMPADRHVAFALTLRDALAKLPRRPPGALYRGVESIPHLDRFRPGETVSFNDFLGSSFDEGVANRFGGFAGVHFTLAGTGGKHIAALSASPAEREVLWDPYSRFRVASRDETVLRDGRTRYEIELHEVP